MYKLSQYKSVAKQPWLVNSQKDTTASLRGKLGIVLCSQLFCFRVCVGFWCYNSWKSGLGYFFLFLTSQDEMVVYMLVFGWLKYPSLSSNLPFHCCQPCRELEPTGFLCFWESVNFVIDKWISATLLPASALIFAIDHIAGVESLNIRTLFPVMMIFYCLICIFFSLLREEVLLCNLLWCSLKGKLHCSRYIQ